MKKQILRVTAMLILYPYIVGFTSDSTSVSPWSLMLGIGGGSYSVVSRDCNGNILASTNIPVTDIAAGVEYSKANGLIGARAGYVSLGAAELITTRSAVYPAYADTEAFADAYIAWVMPYIGLRFKYFELKAGASFQKNSGENTFSEDKKNYTLPHAYLRVGSETGFMVTTSLCNGFPFIAGGGWFDLGAGICLNEQNRTNLWGGFGLVDLDNSLTVFKFSTNIFDDYKIILTGGFGDENTSTLFSAAFQMPLGF